MIKILLILLLLPIGVSFGTDTTKVICGECLGKTAFFDKVQMSANVYTKDKWYASVLGCKPNSLNCRWECIDGDLYRICVTEEPGIDTAELNRTWDTPLKGYPWPDINQDSIDFIQFHDSLWGPPPLFSAYKSILDTIRVVDTVKIQISESEILGLMVDLAWDDDTVGVVDFWGSQEAFEMSLRVRILSELETNSITYRDSVVRACDTTFLYNGSPASDSLQFAICFEKSLFLYMWHRIICRDSVVVMLRGE